MTLTNNYLYLKALYSLHGCEVDHSTSAREYLEGSLVHVIYYKTYYLQFEMFLGLGPTQEWTGEVVVVVGMKINDVELSLMDVYGCAVWLSG